MKVWLVKTENSGVDRVLTAFVSEPLADGAALRMARRAANLGRDPGVPSNPRVLAPDRKVTTVQTPVGSIHCVFKRDDDLDQPGPDGKRVKAWVEIVRYWAAPIEVHGDVISALGAQV